MKRALLLSLALSPIGFAAGRLLASPPERTRAPVVVSNATATGPESPPPAPAPDGAPGAAASWVRRVHAAPWSSGAFEIGREIARLPAQESAGLLKQVYLGIEEPLRRWHFIRGLTQSGPCPRYLDIIRLMLDDPDPVLNARAYGRIEALAFRDLRGNEEELRAWWARYATQPPRVAYLDGMRAFAERIETSDVLHEIDLGSNWNTARCCGLHLRDAAAQSGLTDALVAIARDERRDPDRRRRALEMLGDIDPAREVLEPVVRRALADPKLCEAGIDALLSCDGDWVAKPLFDLVLKDPLRGLEVESALDVLAECADPRAVPYLIAYRQVEPEYSSPARALNLLTGGTADSPERSAASWLEWWEVNRIEFDEAARDIDVPALAAALRAEREGR